MAKIVFFSWRDKFHPAAGGAETYITHVSEHLAAEGHSVTVLSGNYPGGASIQQDNGVSYIRKGNKFSLYLLLPLYYLRNLKTENDILIENYNAWPFLTPLLGKNVVTIIHHIQKQEWRTEFSFIGPILGFFARLFTKIFYRETSIVTVSQSSQDQVTELGIPKDNIVIIPNGIATKLTYYSYSPHPVNAGVRLIALGRVKKHKRLDMLLHALNKVKEALSFPIHFDIVGKGDDEQRLQELTSSLGLEDTVTFHGFVSEESKIELLRESHLHIQLSPREGWGITVTEAASQGVPTFCFKVPGLQDSVKDSTGYIYPEGIALEKVLPGILESIKNTDETYVSRVQEGIKFSSLFSWEKIKQSWSEYIQRVA